MIAVLLRSLACVFLMANIAFVTVGIAFLVAVLRQRCRSE
jgi:hypothetical protein